MRICKAFSGSVMILCSLVLLQHANAATIFAASASLPDVQAAIGIAGNGDRVVIPSGSPTWASTLVINKSIELLGQGSYAVDANHRDVGNWPLVVTFSHGGTGIEVSSISNGTVRISGISFKGTVTYGTIGGGAIVIKETNKTPWRVDNCRFELAGNSIAFCASGLGGLIDHIYTYDPDCTYNNCLQARDERIDHNGDWAYSQPVDFGGSSFVFIEDSTFWKDVANGSATTSITDSQATGKYVFRHNYVKNAMIAWHGSESGAPSRGGYAFEIYDNEFSWDRSDWKYQGAIFQRGGTTLIFNNKATNYHALWKTWVRRATEPMGIFGQADGTKPWDGNWGSPYPVGYPALDQPGRGRANGPTLSTVQPQAESKCYLWNNVLVNCTAATSHNDPTYVVEGRDYVISSDASAKPSGYTPFTYPHPLQTGSGSIPAAPNPPTHLRLQ